VKWLLVRFWVVNPGLLHALSAVCSSDAAVEVVGTVLAVLRMKVPAMGDEPVHAFPVPLLPPEVAPTVVIPDKLVKVA
jgi:hypothetical protein